ncbi:MAG: hypothetical protein DRO01_05745 [Thermoproteota archaeon]|nr:MAG: hypothetical protein DRO01_05745 [Candidatus Korarchaeota archaeon]
MDFKEVWTGKKGGFAESLKKNLAPQKNLRPKLENAIKLLQKQMTKLDVSIRNLREKDRVYFAKVVESIKNHDRTMATLYANELVEIRKALKVLKQARYAIHSVVVRLKTVESISDAAAEILPAMQVLRNVKGMVSYILPIAEDGLNEVGSLLQDIMWEATQTGESAIDMTAANDEAIKILNEAERLAQEDMRKELPGIPESISEGESRVSQGEDFSEFRF